MNIQDWFTLLFGASSITTAFGWIAERRRRRAEVHTLVINNESAIIDNERKRVDLYKDLLDDLSARYEAKYKEFENMHERKVKLLEDEIRLHKRAIAQLKLENQELKAKLKTYADKNTT